MPAPEPVVDEPQVAGGETQDAGDAIQAIKDQQQAGEPQAAANGNGEAAANGNGEAAEEDPADELKRLREENASLKKQVEEKDKELETLKAEKQKKKSGGFFTRKKKPTASQAEGDHAEHTAPTPEDEVAPEGAAESDGAAAAVASSEEGASSPDKKRKSGGIKDKLGKAFGRFRQPKGYEETPTEPGAADLPPAELVIPERQQVEWTVAKSFEPAEQKTEEPAEGEAAAAAEGETAAADESAEPPKRVCCFKDWSVEQVREWLIDLQLEQYSEACQLTGEQMLATSNAQFEKELGVRNAIHRKKLRLTLNAIASGEELPSVLFDWDIKAVVELMQYNGLPQYVLEAFVADSVDGRVLTFLTPDDLNLMKISIPFVQSAIKRATQLLRQNNYTKDYMKTFVEPEQEPEPTPEPAEEAAPAAAEAASEPAAEEAKPAEEAAAPAEGEAKPAEDGDKPAEGEAAAAAEGEAKADAPAEKTETELKAEEDAKAAEEAKKRDEEERRKAEAAKERQRRHYARCAEALKEQKPLITWSNDDVAVWARSVDLVDQAVKVLGSGLSGALMVLDTCFTGESLCSVLGVPAKNPLRAEVQAKFTELVGEEVAGEKTEASKLDGYAVLIAGQKAKRKRSLSFSGALRRRTRGANTATTHQQSPYLLTFDEASEAFVAAHATDCSVPKPAPGPKKEEAKEEPAAAAATPEGEEKKDGAADDEKVPLVEGEEAKTEGEAEAAPADETNAAAPAEAAPAEETAPAEKSSDKTDDDVDNEEQKLLDGDKA